jgi:hypothetical protein
VLAINNNLIMRVVVAMDDFVKASARRIGPGGLKCSCCNDFRTSGTHGKRHRGLNKLRRKRLKLDLVEYLAQAEIDTVLL